MASAAMDQDSRSRSGLWTLPQDPQPFLFLCRYFFNPFCNFFF